MESQRHLFNLREGESYLNCAFKAPLLKKGEEEAIRSLRRGRNPIDINPDHYFDEVEHVRKLFATLINSTYEQVVCIPSVSYGFASVLNNIRPKKNGRCLIQSDEFPSGYFALKRWCEENDNVLEVVNHSEAAHIGRSWFDNLMRAIDDSVSVVIVSPVHWMRGTKFDIEAIGFACKNVGAKLLVDGSQSVGIMPIDVKKYNVDCLICAGYKWLLGPYSTSWAYFSEEFNSGKPIEESWMNRKGSRNFSGLMNYSMEYEEGAARFNVGEMSKFVAMPIAKCGLEQILEWQVERMQAYCNKLIVPLMDFVQHKGVHVEEEEFRAPHLIGLKLPSKVNPQEIKDSLKERKVGVSVRGDFVRVSVNVFNTKDDIDQLILSLNQVV